MEIIRIKSTKTELIIEIDLYKTFKGKEMNLNQVRMLILPKNMISKFKEGKQLLPSKIIEKKSSTGVYYSKYPIITTDISVYIPAEISLGESIAKLTADIGSKVIKPVVGTLMILSMPVAVTLLKLLQSLEYLVFINVKNMPSNVQFLLNIIEESNIFSGMTSSIENLWQFDDGRGETEEDQHQQQSGRRMLTRVSTPSKGDTQPVCRTHKVLDQQEMSCMGWNNFGSFTMQILALIFTKGLFYLLSSYFLKREKRKLASIDL